MIQNLHAHTTFCDGKDTPEELVHEAIRMDMDSLGFSSHAPLAGQGIGTWLRRTFPATGRRY